MMGLLAGLTLVVGAGIWTMLQSHNHVCDRCGAERFTLQFGAGLGFKVSVKVADTPLSKVLREEQILSEHEHHWLYDRGRAFGVVGMIGQGRHLRRTTQSTEFATTIQILHQRKKFKVRDEWLCLGLDPLTAICVSGSVISDPTLSDSELDLWVAEQRSFIRPFVDSVRKDRERELNAFAAP